MKKVYLSMFMAAVALTAVSAENPFTGTFLMTYDLSGCRISHPSGICIMVKGSKATKLVMPVR